MGKLSVFIPICCLSGILGVISELFGSMKLSYSILMLQILLDTITGIAAALKYKRFSSKGLLKITRKILLYTSSIATVRLLEIGIESIYKTTLLSQFLIAFFIITEVISVLENLTILGAPIPSNFVVFMLNNIKIPGLSNAIIETKNSEMDFQEIDDIIKYQLPAFENTDIRKVLEIEFKIMQSIATQVYRTVDGLNIDSNDHLYFKIMSIIELGFDDIKNLYKLENVCLECVEKFSTTHQPKVDKWLQNVKETCYSEGSVQRKKEKFVDSILVLLYESVIDAHKISH